MVLLLAQDSKAKPHDDRGKTVEAARVFGSACKRTHGLVCGMIAA
jgi:hypothetical protein